MNRQQNQKETGTNRDRVIDILERTRQIVYEMERLASIIVKFEKLVSAPELLIRFKKDWIALSYAIRFYKIYETSNVSSDIIQSNLNTIRIYDPELGLDISKLLPAPANNLNVFPELFDAYSQGRLYLISYISTHVKELITKANSIENKSYSRRLVELFSIISGHEVEYLMKYRNDCTNWANIRYAVNHDIDYFIRRLNLYIKGGFEDNIQFMGLYGDFGDRVLTTSLLESNAVKRLWRFHEQINYLKLAIEKCKAAQKSGEWEGFFGKGGFWPEFDAFTKEFAIKYGNLEFADILKSKKKVIGETPSGWGGRWQGNKMLDDGILPQLLRRLQNPEYTIRNFLIPASIDLSELFKKREEELIKTRDTSVDNLIGSLYKLSGIGYDKEKVLGKFKRLLIKRKLRLSKNIEYNVEELISKTDTLLNKYREFSQFQKNVMAKVDLDFMANRMKILASLAESHSMYLAKRLRSDDLLSNINSLVDMDGSNSVLDETSSEIVRLMRYEHISEQEFQNMERLIVNALNLTNSLRSFVVGYIKYKIEKEYTIRIEDMEKIPINISELNEVPPKLKDEKIPEGSFEFGNRKAA